MLEPDPERLLQGVLPAARRRKLRWADRKIEDQGFTVQELRARDGITRALEAFLAHKARWFDERGITNPFAEPGLHRFLVDLASVENSPIGVFGLVREDQVAAVAIVIDRHHRTSLMAISYDPDSPVRPYSPGIRVVRELIANSCRRGMEVFDFGLGEAAYKSFFGAQAQPSFVDLRPLTARGRLLALGYDTGRRAKILLKQYPGALTFARRARGWLP